MKLGKGLVSVPGLALVCSLVVVSCSKSPAPKGTEITSDNLVTSDPYAAKQIGDAKSQYLVLGQRELANRLAAKTMLPVDAPEAVKLLESRTQVTVKRNFATVASGTKDSNLTLGFPIGLLNERQMFGAVITKVSDKTSEDLGRLRLSDLPPIHVRAVIGKSQDDKYLLALVGCTSACAEGSKESTILAVPILGVDEEKGLVMVDLAVLGKDLNLVAMKDPFGMVTKLKTKTSETIAFDYSYSSLVFDIKTIMVPVEAKPEEGEDGEEAEADVKETEFQARWYLRLTSTFDSAFDPRPATKGVGYFMTRRAATSRITRFAKPANEGGVKYYLKNIPKEFRPSFSAAFDAWNERFKTATGKNLLSYEFLEEADPRYKVVVAGDIRFNVLEWDVDNVAPYGGFGPSIANQHTGQMLSANVLIQGPKIVEGYSKWFKAAGEAGELINAGRDRDAQRLLRATLNQLHAREEKLNERTFSVSLGEGLDFQILSQTPPYEDPAFAARTDFDLPPKGFTYETYMDGYFQDMVAHELGHNLGLRHNFRGNLSGKDTPKVGEVSHSIMEYLGRSHRHLDRIGTYDLMAIKYGYAGTAPDKLDMFCTDEDVPNLFAADSSAECSRDDASSDPFGWFGARVARAGSLLVAQGKDETPQWTISDVDRDLTASILGMAFYATSAEATGGTWTNFFKSNGRPAKVGEVPEYVLKELKALVCNPELDKAVESKTSATAKDVAAANLKDLRGKLVSLVEPLEFFSADELKCKAEDEEIAE